MNPAIGLHLRCSENLNLSADGHGAVMDTSNLALVLPLRAVLVFLNLNLVSSLGISGGRFVPFIP